MYKETLRSEDRQDTGNPAIETSKVNKICNAFLEALADRVGNAKNMITAQVCKNPPDFDAGLVEIVRLKGEPTHCSRPEDRSLVRYVQAVK